MRLRGLAWAGWVVVLAGCPQPTADEVPTAEPVGWEVQEGVEGAPEIWTTAAEVEAACARHLAAAKAARDGVLAADRTGEGLLQPLNDALFELDHMLPMAELLASVSPDEAVRTAAGACRREATGVLTGIERDPELYQALSTIDPDTLDPSARRFREVVLANGLRAGADRDEATRTRLAGLRAQMVELGQQYATAIREDRRFADLPSADLDGLPADFLQAHPAVDGQVRISTDYPDLYPLLTYARSESARSALYTESLRRAHPANAETLRRLLLARHQYATALGFSSWADYATAGQALGDGRAVAEFLDRVAAIARPRMERDLRDLLARKRLDVPEAEVVRGWDRFYYPNRLQAEQRGVDAGEVRAYFEVSRVLDGLLALHGDLFGVSFVRDEGAPTWHDSVQVYGVVEGGVLWGRLYVDAYPRPAKYAHVHAFPMATGVLDRRLPAVALVANLPQPREGRPALVEHDDVAGLFHEFGHVMHHILGGRQRWVPLSRPEPSSDLGETPAELAEEWAWEPDVLQRYAVHHLTGEPIPTELVENMRLADESCRGLRVMQQLFYAALSLRYHDRDPSDIDLVATLEEVQRQYGPHPYEPDTHLYANFEHLESFDSRYYTYMWSLVIAKDLHARFEQAGVMDQATALAYRRAILDPGSSVPLSECIEGFLGRPAYFDAFWGWLEQGG